MQRSFLWYLPFVILILLSALGTAFYLQLQQLNAYVVPEREEPFELTAGMRARNVIMDLTDEQFNPAVVWVYVKLNEKELSAIQRGSYVVDGTTSLSTILQRMVRGEVYQPTPFTLTIVEGMNIKQLEARMRQADKLNFDAQACFTDPAVFMQEVLSPDDLRFIGGAKDSLEGLLLPATYPYFSAGSAKALLTQALRAMVQLLKTAWEQRCDNRVLASPYEALILASLVERESSLSSEKPLIAGVFCNRLLRGMRLQTDPAVMYGVAPDFRGPLKRSQLLKDSPYNTYTRDGLPPTPIAQPSREALLAALHPADTQALYFVAKSYDPQDGHNFAVSLREHNRNVDAYKKSVRAYKRAQAQQ